MSNESVLNVKNNYAFFFKNLIVGSAPQWQTVPVCCFHTALSNVRSIIQTHTGEWKWIFVLASNVSGRKLAMCWNNSAVKVLQYITDALLRRGEPRCAWREVGNTSSAVNSLARVKGQPFLPTNTSPCWAETLLLHLYQPQVYMGKNGIWGKGIWIFSHTIKVSLPQCKKDLQSNFHLKQASFVACLNIFVVQMKSFWIVFPLRCKKIGRQRGRKWKETKGRQDRTKLGCFF